MRWSVTVRKQQTNNASHSTDLMEECRGGEQKKDTAWVSKYFYLNPGQHLLINLTFPSNTAENKNFAIRSGKKKDLAAEDEMLLVKIVRHRNTVVDANGTHLGLSFRILFVL